MLNLYKGKSSTFAYFYKTYSLNLEIYCGRIVRLCPLQVGEVKSSSCCFYCFHSRALVLLQLLMYQLAVLIWYKLFMGH